jgi:hypothetical protein
VEAVIRNAQLGEELESGVKLVLRLVERAATLLPGVLAGARSKGVTTVRTEGVPVGDGKAQVFAHGLFAHHSVGVIGLERQRVVGTRPFVRDGRNPREVFAVADEGLCTHVIAPTRFGIMG